MSDENSSPHSQPCPLCKAQLHRSRATRIDQVIRKRFTNRRLFRCATCGWRGWAMPIERAVAAAPIAGHSLNLGLLDEDE